MVADTAGVGLKGNGRWPLPGYCGKGPRATVVAGSSEAAVRCSARSTNKKGGLKAVFFVVGLLTLPS